MASRETQIPLTAAQLVQLAINQVNTISWEKFLAVRNDPLLLIDVREPAEYANSHVPHAINIPRGTIEFEIASVPVLKYAREDNPLEYPIYLYCHSGGRSALTAQSLQLLGYSNLWSIDGGYARWIKLYPADT